MRHLVTVITLYECIVASIMISELFLCPSIFTMQRITKPDIHSIDKKYSKVSIEAQVCSKEIYNVVSDEGQVKKKRLLYGLPSSNSRNMNTPYWILGRYMTSFGLSAI